MPQLVFPDLTPMPWKRIEPEYFRKRKPKAIKICPECHQPMESDKGHRCVYGCTSGDCWVYSIRYPRGRKPEITYATVL
jgi:hypothetical protein